MTQSYPAKHPLEIGVIMDPHQNLAVHKDSTLALILAAQRRGWRVRVMQQGDLLLRDGRPYAWMRHFRLDDISGQAADWCAVGAGRISPLGDLDVILMRKDPPFNMDYIYTTYFLDLAGKEGTLIVNEPRSLRDCNEKFFATHFPECCPPILITQDARALRAFHAEHGQVVMKPLDGMGGAGIFCLLEGDKNVNVVIETLTKNGHRQIMAQRYIPEISQGDKRILLIDGRATGHALARIPAPGEHRGNLATGGRAEGREMTARDHWICDRVGPELRRRGLLFAGLDIIGDYLTEINVTCPTGIRELDAAFDLDVGGDLMDHIAAMVAHSQRPVRTPEARKTQVTTHGSHQAH